jgi:hypothetical protein
MKRLLSIIAILSLVVKGFYNEICPEGYYCVDEDAYPCLAGTYSPFGDHTCHDCPAGSYCVERAPEPILCPGGFYSAAKAETCETCPAGSHCAEGSITPTQCVDGEYSY